MFAHLSAHSSDFGDICALCARCLHQLTMQSSLFDPGRPVLVVVCVARKLRPCPSYSRHTDRINLGLWRSLYKGGGGTHLFASCLSVLAHPPTVGGWLPPTTVGSLQPLSSTAVSYSTAAADYPQPAIACPPTAVDHPPTARSISCWLSLIQCWLPSISVNDVPTVRLAKTEGHFFGVC